MDKLRAYLADRLRALRLDAGWTLDAAAETSGVSRSTISRLEAGTHEPTVCSIAMLAKAYGVTMSALLADYDG